MLILNYASACREENRIENKLAAPWLAFQQFLKDAPEGERQFTESNDFLTRAREYRFWYLDPVVTVFSACVLAICGVMNLVTDTHIHGSWWTLSFWCAPIPPKEAATPGADKAGGVSEATRLVP